MLTLGIETSCDETSAAVLENGSTLRSNVISSQIDVHAKFGGVVPEIAAREHAGAMNSVMDAALSEAGVGFRDLDLVAVTAGPGLAISLVVGLSAARAISYALGIPAVGVNHLEGHVMANFLDGDRKPETPALCLLVSGGHTEIILVDGPGAYRKLGGTVDDAAGEAFDKVARLLELGYPGGPVIEKVSKGVAPGDIVFPRPMIHQKNLNFSFSGLKTAVINFLHNNKEKIGGEYTKAQIASAFQEAVADVLVRKTLRAASERGVKSIMLAGGVAANALLRNNMKAACEDRNISFFLPPLILCTDNAGMIAKTGFELLRNGRDGLDLTPHPNCPLDQLHNS